MVNSSSFLRSTLFPRLVTADVHSHPLAMQSAIEETLARIGVMTGVEGYVIVDHNVSTRRGAAYTQAAAVGATTAIGCLALASSAPQGVLLRHSKSFTQDQAIEFSNELRELTQKARHVVRDLEPRDDLKLFRLRGKEKEILVTPSQDFMVFVVQRWRVSQLDQLAAE